MNEATIERLAQRLRTLRKAAQIRAFRQQLDASTARAVIMHPCISPLERASISLCLQFATPEGNKFWQRLGPDAEIFDASEYPELTTLSTDVPGPPATDACHPQTDC